MGGRGCCPGGGGPGGGVYTKNGNYAFHNAQLPHRTYIEMKKLSYL